MYSALLNSLKQWNKANDRHTKLQHVYAVSAIALLVVAGLVGLVNFDLGQTLMTTSFMLAAIFFVNAIAWALVDAFIIPHLTKRSNKR